VFGHPVVSYWMHGDHLMLSGTRMAKSAGNFFRITELEEQGYDPLAFRYLALQARYRTKLSFSPDALAGAARALRQLGARVAEWRSEPVVVGSPSHGSAGYSPDFAGESKSFSERFRTAISDDLDLPAAMALVSELTRSDLAPSTRASLLLDWDRVLALD